MGCRIEIQSNFNLSLWEKKLKEYEDRHIVNMLRFGFPLGIKDRSGLKRKYIENHSSPLQFKQDVQKFIDKELTFKALLGPFSHPPHPLFHCSPLLIRPKEGSSRRVIVDLSYGDQGEAVNKVTDKNTYEGLEFILQLPTLDHLLQQALSLNIPKLIKVDISRAFRNVPIDPRDAVKCGIKHEGKFYLDKFLVFGQLMAQ